MTFSILAHDPQTGCIGVAIASRFFAVGAICPFIFPGIGAIVSQAAGHPPFGPAAEPLLRQGMAAPLVIETLLASDPSREMRQLHVLDRAGSFAGFTGRDCVLAAGYRCQAGQMSVAGNMLASDEVLNAAVGAFDPSLPLAPRLLEALKAAHAAGGDKRGQQAAALIIYGSQDFPLLSLRVDDDVVAIDRLADLYAGASADYIPFMRNKASAGEAAAVFGA